MKKNLSVEKKNKKGFTLAELLIVVAIVAVLVAIAIPVFISLAEKSKEATDLANARNAYAEVMVAVLEGDESKVCSFEIKQTQSDWQTKGTLTVGGINHVKGDETTNPNWKGVPEAGGTCTVSFTGDKDGDGKADSVLILWGMGFSLHNYCWNGADNAANPSTTNGVGTMFSTSYNGSSKYPGLYELKPNTEYSVSFTYDPLINSLGNNYSAGIVARAMMIYDSQGNKAADTGTGNYKTGVNLSKSNGGVTVNYKYTQNSDGTVTYTATFKTPNKSDAYYYGMNFGSVKLDSNGKNCGDVKLDTLDGAENSQNQILSTFEIHQVTK